MASSLTQQKDTHLGVPVNFTARKQLRITHENQVGENVNHPLRVVADLGRREFLVGFAAAGANVLISGSLLAAQTSKATPHRIDIHNHLTPASYAAELGPKHLLSAPVLNWTPAKDIEDMDAAGVATSITSLAPPGVWNGDDAAARHLARSCNEEAARLVADHRGRFGMFVNLPLPDVEGSLHEIEYGLDTLKADGVAMYTSYGDKWLGDRAFDPVFDELNRRGAVVYTHPKSANCCKNVLANIPDSEIEYGTDTTRAITQLVFGGTTRRCPNIRFIFSHAGGAVPYLAQRIAAELEERQKRKPEVGEVEIYGSGEEIRRIAPADAEMAPMVLKDRTIILVDDVIYTGRTVNSALSIIFRSGRPQSVRLAVLIDRGHREVPLKPNYVGKHIPSSERERVRVKLREVEHDEEDKVVIYSIIGPTEA